MTIIQSLRIIDAPKGGTLSIDPSEGQGHVTGCISIGRFSALGAEGCKFKSCHPDGVA
jgi:hypothetical protein